MKYTGKVLQTLQDKGRFLLLGNNLRGEISSVLRYRYIKLEKIEKKDFTQVLRKFKGLGYE